ncbi:restriction endonuclease [Eubacterium sp. An3]|uniref:restriction endonuclease n=1 Tax=Eubacterium sp. An3 TaxID=1965628 RepID=UPI00194F2489|nr:restriction endonuclease [Eubacterium sp. An3]
MYPRASYKISGEQIDGSVVLGDKVYLLEAKWYKKEMATSDIYAFKGKVDEKLVGTIGIFISISGFSKDSVDALIFGKEITVILFDKMNFLPYLKCAGCCLAMLYKIPVTVNVESVVLMSRVEK